MLFHYVLLSCLLTCVITKQAYGREFREDVDDVYPSWPSYQVAEATLKKRQAPLKPGLTDTSPLHVNQTEKSADVADNGALKQASEGNVINNPAPIPLSTTIKPHDTVSNNSDTAPKPVPTANIGNVSQTENVTANNSSSPSTNITSSSNTTAPKAPSYQPDLSNPGVMKRGLIVFGAFALMAVAYFIFYRRKNKNNDSSNTHGTSDTNQFRYGVLQSDDRRDNLELSRVPLTMESDEDEDEDLEIFDLEQKKKSLSYVNLQTNDEYIVEESREAGRDRDNLLLDIEDANSDTLINWSTNGNKSIL